MKLLDLEIFTKRILLQPISLKYKEDIFREFTETITTYMHPHPPQVISETELFIHESLREMHNGDNLIVVIVKKDNNEFLGCTGIHKLKSICPELGIWLKKSAHGHGYGLEAINALKVWAESNLDYEYLIYPVDRANISSRSIPERLGGQIFREYEQTNLSGKVLHLLEYKIFKQ
ncbi:GNAT family N-acetyltransferase [Nostocales cyanobacterium LEGE 11386]|nr:GNAT family N-acetyltransferase [Nostocales cyanobacterium LEGE 11386]